MIVLKVFGISLLRIRIFLSEEGLFLSLNGKKGKEIKRKKKKKSIFGFSPFSAIKIRSFDLSVRAGGSPDKISPILAILKSIAGTFLSYLSSEKIVDEWRVRVLPSYDEKRATVNFTISIFTSLAFLLSSFTHTTKGDQYAKRNDRKYNG